MSRNRVSVSIIISMLILSAAFLLFLPGCTWLEVAETTKEISDKTSAIGDSVPGDVGLLLKLGSAIISAVSGIAFGLHKWGVSVKLKKAIRTRGASIDAAKAAPDTGTSNAARKVCEFIKEFETLHNPPVKKYGGLFDAVRKYQA